MAVTIRNVALLGATGTLGAHICAALTQAGFVVTAIQRKGSTNPVPSGVKSIKVDLSNKDDLTSAFKGQDAVVSAVPDPTLATESIMIDAAIAAAVKRIVPSEYSTNFETPLSRQLPIVKDKAQIREYLESAIANNGTSTTWSSVNNGPFFEICLKQGALGPNIKEKKAIFHNGGNLLVGTSTLPDIAATVVKILDPAYLDETANKSVYIHSAAVSERLLTKLASEVTGIDFGDVESGKILDLDIDLMVTEAEEKLAKGDKSGWSSFYYQMMYAKGYGGEDFEKLSWNERLGLRTMDEADIKGLIRSTSQELGVPVGSNTNT
ncbi:NAD(P)-binding protein [Daldinia decipiens]|uniref:NAD(P)-binding protein n=1 Tax=Daldinia decipiens TaxID=326647 RepID=UPI0020C4B174|nr:NAD(P)-binding protein [Daldinia decipiens]KAI1660578.1 NAD(P)-binding protein [Daldinia decipiens]